MANIGELPESYDDWKTRTFELEDDCEQVDNRTPFEHAIDRQIELERIEEADHER